MKFNDESKVINNNPETFIPRDDVEFEKRQKPEDFSTAQGNNASFLLGLFAVTVETENKVFTYPIYTSHLKLN